MFPSPHVIDEGYWREPLDLSISMTLGGQFFKYFHQHIYPIMNVATSESSFYQYAELPAELQLRILQQCHAPTLFQLMHTTRDLRIESKKLFFSDQTTWYRIPVGHLLLGGLPGESMYDLDFLASIEQLDFKCFLEITIYAGIGQFWQNVQRLCPRIKRVMFSTEGASFHDEPHVFGCYRKMAQLCPRGIDVFFYTPEKEKEAVGRRVKRVLWRLRAAHQDLDTSITPKREEHFNHPAAIVVPPEKPYRGRVGDFLKSRTLWNKFNGQRFAAKMHRAAAIEKHYFEGRHEPFGCSVTGCGAWFEQPEQYTTHLLATGHGPDETAPASVEALFAENTKRIQRLREEQIEAHRYFWNWWGEWPTEQRNMAEKEVMDQLEHDALYAEDKPVANHGLLLMIHDVEDNQAV
ncbi:hypothetical protein K504DRAFT_453735 [Pleomassaria siparia CBS 279.74]|uniref:F-box domain-containing protein n=1 Tax=Pleomassaria siparia CBS 279.74 TaxID=1314801 RepID=A0A6G1KDV8_9PLEO|nr:hypothetical protein K504DRAFT_453735 [Pleomassaria siparia CBS 279.74]